MLGWLAGCCAPKGEQGDELFLLFDGVLRVEIDGKSMTEVSLGAILGRAGTAPGPTHGHAASGDPCRIAVVPNDHIDRQALQELAKGRMPRPER